jgi:hypothetical protein
VTKEDIPILITSAINVSADKTALRNSSDRLTETLKGLQEWLRLPCAPRIVLCDGSGFDLGPFLADLPCETKKRVEHLSFTNSVDMVRTRGKGWGEGEIVNFALEHSETLRAASAFAKCTGKLWIPNYVQCVRKFNGVASFDFNGRLKPRFIDTRFYIVSKDFFFARLANVYKTVQDNQGFYLEHAFLHALGDVHPGNYAMLPVPWIQGTSGSMATRYEQPRLKRLVRSGRTLLLRAGMRFGVWSWRGSASLGTSRED